MSTSRRNQIKALKKRVKFLEKQVDGLNKVVFGMLHELGNAIDFLRVSKLNYLEGKVFDWYMSLTDRDDGVNSEGTND